jgi:fibrillarin-like rRNA methylase
MEPVNKEQMIDAIQAAYNSWEERCKNVTTIGKQLQQTGIKLQEAILWSVISQGGSEFIPPADLPEEPEE